MATATDNQLPPTEITALLGRGTRFEGKLHFDGRVRVDGYFQGEINSDDTLIIGDGAEVHAEIEVATVIVRGGQVHGNIKARNAIEIHAPGKMIGNLHSPSLFIDRGVEFQGSCRMDPIEEKSTATVPAANTPVAKAAAPAAPLPPAAPSAPAAPAASGSAATPPAPPSKSQASA
jgi:cytoskeletal protein CcmA (bactofilin family)